MPGTILAREYQGRDIVVKVLDNDFEFEGRRHNSTALTPNGNRRKPSSPASATKAGYACRIAMMTAAFPAATWTGPPCKVSSPISRPAASIAWWSTKDESELSRALAVFNALWDSLSLREQARILRLLIERVGLDGRDGKVIVTFRSAGIRSLCTEVGLIGNEDSI